MSEIILVKKLISPKVREIMKLALAVISAALCLCLFLTSCGEKDPASSAETGSTQPASEDTPEPAPEPENTPEPTPEPEETPEPTSEPEETPEPTPEPEETPEPAPASEETPEPAPASEETPEATPEPEDDAPAAQRRNRSKVPPPGVIDRTVKPVAPAPR